MKCLFSLLFEVMSATLGRYMYMHIFITWGMIQKCQCRVRVAQGLPAERQAEMPAAQTDLMRLEDNRGYVCFGKIRPDIA